MQVPLWSRNGDLTIGPSKFQIITWMKQMKKERKVELHENRRKSNEEKAISQEDMTQELHQQIKSEHA